MLKSKKTIKMIPFFALLILSVFLLASCEGRMLDGNSAPTESLEDSGDYKTADLEQNASFKVLQSCGNVELTMKELVDMDSKAEFEAEVQTDGEEPVKAKFIGIQLKDALMSKGVDLSSVRTVAWDSGENYEYILDSEELSKDDKCYLVFSVDDKSISTEDGPFQFVIKSDKEPFNRIKSANKIMLIQKGPT